MSTEKSVRVRVKVYDNTTSIYSQDIEITNGEGTFVVPAIMADSDVIALQVGPILYENFLGQIYRARFVRNKPRVGE